MQFGTNGTNGTTTVTDSVGSHWPSVAGVSDPQSLCRTTGCRAMS